MAQKKYLDSEGVKALWGVIKSNFAGPNALSADSLKVGKDITQTVEGQDTPRTVIKSNDSVGTALATLVTAINTGGTGSVVSVETLSTPTDGYLKTYSIKQGGTEVGKIDIPKDKVLTNAAMLYGSENAETHAFTELDPSDEEGEWYLRLTFANIDPANVYIPINAFIDGGEFYKGSTGAINVTINQNTREITAELSSNFKLTEAQLPDSISSSKLTGEISSSLLPTIPETKLPTIPASKISDLSSDKVSHQVSATLASISGYASQVNTVQKAINSILESSHSVANNGGIFHKVAVKTATGSTDVTFSAYNTETKTDTSNTISLVGDGVTIDSTDNTITISADTTAALTSEEILSAITAANGTAPLS